MQYGCFIRVRIRNANLYGFATQFRSTAFYLDIAALLRPYNLTAQMDGKPNAAQTGLCSSDCCIMICILFVKFFGTGGLTDSYRLSLSDVIIVIGLGLANSVTNARFVKR